MSAAPLSKEVVRAVQDYQRLAYRWLNCEISWDALRSAEQRMLHVLRVSAPYRVEPAPKPARKGRAK